MKTYADVCHVLGIHPAIRDVTFQFDIGRVPGCWPHLSVYMRRPGESVGSHRYFQNRRTLRDCMRERDHLAAILRDAGHIVE